MYKNRVPSGLPARTPKSLPTFRIIIELFPAELSLQRMRGIFKMLDEQIGGPLNTQKRPREIAHAEPNFSAFPRSRQNVDGGQKWPFDRSTAALKTPAGTSGYIWTPTEPTKCLTSSESNGWAPLKCTTGAGGIAHSLKIYLMIREAHCDAAVHRSDYNLLTPIYC